MTLRILFVCMGNICRSPTAEGILRAKLDAAGLAEAVELDSAGTGDWHVGKAPESNSTASARPAAASLALRMPSAVGERQMLPMQTNRMRRVI